MKKHIEIEIENVNYLFRKFEGNGHVIFGIDNLAVEDDGMDLVAYDTSEYEQSINEGEEISVDGFHRWVGETGGDEENYEMDRVTLVRNSL